jgi:DNA/RNA-binding protein KIN17
MGKRAEVGTPKYLANAMKSKGLQRLRWFCQVCEKQCRDENGFKCHTQSEGHLRQMLVVGESAGRHIQDYSMQFQSEFVSLLSRTCGTQRVKANNIYQDYIRDKSHLHMNATRWVTLTGFISHLGQAGIVRVEDTETGLFISWVDNSPKALAKAESTMKKERLNKSDEQRERDMIKEQIERASAMEQEARGGRDDAGSSGDNAEASVTPPPPTELKLGEGEKVKFSFSLKKPAASNSPPAPATTIAPTSTSTAEGSSTSPTASESPAPIPASSSTPAPAPVNVFKTNVFKMSAPKSSAPPANVFKMGGSSGKSSMGSLAGTKRPLSVTEALMQEDMERKRRRMDREGVSA